MNTPNEYTILVSTDPDRYGYEVTPADVARIVGWIREQIAAQFPGASIEESTSTSPMRCTGPDAETCHRISEEVHRLERVAARAVTGLSGSQRTPSHSTLTQSQTEPTGETIHSLGRPSTAT